MDTGRFRLDSFAIALAALSLSLLVFVGMRDGAALVMSGLCFAGLLTARVAGFSNRALVPLTIGLVAILWMIAIAPDVSSHTASVIAHAGGGVLLGWAVCDYLGKRLDWPRWALAAVAVVFGLTIVWEIGEAIGDEVLSTALDPNLRDSALDITFGTLGGAVAVALAAMLPASLRR